MPATPTPVASSDSSPTTRPSELGARDTDPAERAVHETDPVIEAVGGELPSQPPSGDTEVAQPSGKAAGSDKPPDPAAA